MAIKEEKENSGSDSSVENETARDPFKTNIDKISEVTTTKNMD